LIDWSIGIIRYLEDVERMSEYRKSETDPAFGPKARHGHVKFPLSFDITRTYTPSLKAL
jgi:hypothetical protein